MLLARYLRLALSLLMTLVIVITAPAPGSGTMDPTWVENWREDLAVAHQALRDNHPSPFDALTSEALQAEFDQLVRRLPDLTHHEIITELARIVARIEDGHTRLTLPLAPGVDFIQGHSETERPISPEMEFHQYPLRLAIDGEGIWIQAISREFRRLLGGRLVAIDDHSAAKVVELVSPTIERDNEMQVLHHLPMHLVLPELLHARRVTKSADRASFRIEMRDGSVETVVLHRAPDETAIEWVETGPAEAGSVSLLHRRNDENFWFTHLESSRLVYLQFNTVYDKEEETIRQFSERLTEFLKEVPQATLVIDLRHNRGGNQSLALPLLHAVIASPQNLSGQLFTIIGRTTFSAAMNFSLQMEKHTQTLFVGEPTGSKPNHYGDSRKTLLPNSNVTLRISSLYWQWHPTDSRSWIVPHVEAPLTLEAVLADEDPALQVIESVIATVVPPEVDGAWKGNLPPASFGLDSVLRLDSRSGPLQGSVDIPPFGVDGVSVGNLEVEEATISFQILIGSETLSYQARMNDRWIVGQGDLGSVRFPILLEHSTIRAP